MLQYFPSFLVAVMVQVIPRTINNPIMIVVIDALAAPITF